MMDATLGGRVRDLRKQRDMTQDDLASILDVDKSAISRIERGDRGLAAEEIALLASTYSVTADFLLFGDRAEEVVMLRADGDASAALEEAREILADMEFLSALLA